MVAEAMPRQTVTCVSSSDDGSCDCGELSSADSVGCVSLSSDDGSCDCGQIEEQPLSSELGLSEAESCGSGVSHAQSRSESGME